MNFQISHIHLKRTNPGPRYLDSFAYTPETMATTTTTAGTKTNHPIEMENHFHLKPQILRMASICFKRFLGYFRLSALSLVFF